MTTQVLALAVVDWTRLVSSAVVPVVVISAASLMCLAFYNRLGLIIARLRQLTRERLQLQDALLPHVPDGAGRTVRVARHRKQALLDEMEQQTSQIVRRARLIRGTLLSLLTAVALMIVASLMLGASVVWPPGALVAVPLFVLGLLAMLAGVGFAMAELFYGLLPVELELRMVEQLDDELDGDLDDSGAPASP